MVSRLHPWRVANGEGRVHRYKGLLFRKVLRSPGKTTIDQLQLIIEVTGLPSGEDVHAMNSPLASSKLEGLLPSNPRSLAERYSGCLSVVVL